MGGRVEGRALCLAARALVLGGRLGSRRRCGFVPRPRPQYKIHCTCAHDDAMLPEARLANARVERGHAAGPRRCVYIYTRNLLRRSR